MKHFAIIAILFTLLPSGPIAAKEQKPLVVTTTIGQLSDMLEQIGGHRLQVQSLMGPGVDPHLYRATASDLTKLEEADIIFYVGLKLEGKMDDLFKRLAKQGKAVFGVAEQLPTTKLLKPESFAGHYDPHIWFDIALWTDCVDIVVGHLSRLDPQATAYYKRRGQQLSERLTQLKNWAISELGSIPKIRRILITSHDAFNYFGRAFDFQVVGLQGISTVTESGLADMAKMVDFIKEHRVKAIFVESSVSKKAIERVSQDAGVKIAGEIFSDAMGVPGHIENDYDEGTYDGMIRHNIATIVSALK